MPDPAEPPVPKKKVARKGWDMELGLVTYQWGKDWDLETLIEHCEKARIHAVELRTTHKHGVEPSLSKQDRAAVKRRFEASPVMCIGPGSNEKFHHADPEQLKAAIETSKAFIRLSHDIGGTGVKVKPDGFVKGKSARASYEQVGKALRELAEYGEGFGQELRLEVHGKMAGLPHIKAVMDVADHANARVCWNCNDSDLEGEGLAHNFKLVNDYFGETLHVRELNAGSYPYQELFKLLVGMDYAGWILLECSSTPADRVAAMAEQRKLWLEMMAKAREAAG